MTIIEQAIILVPALKYMLDKLAEQVTLRGQSPGTLHNYSRRIALFVLHFRRLSKAESEDEIHEYLVALARDPKSPLRSSFKHMVYGLRYYFHLLDMNTRAIA